MTNNDENAINEQAVTEPEALDTAQDNIEKLDETAIGGAENTGTAATEAAPITAAAIETVADAFSGTKEEQENEKNKQTAYIDRVVEEIIAETQKVLPPIAGRGSPVLTPKQRVSSIEEAGKLLLKMLKQ